MRHLSHLFDNNRGWAQRVASDHPGFFARLSDQQSPEYLWIGCSDSRVPANQIVGLAPGELFVHRNVANIVANGDLNCLSVLQFAVEVLKVKHVIVCGHYGCGGVLAAMRDAHLGLVDNWLRFIQDIQLRYRDLLNSLTSEANQFERMCELNVIRQAMNVARTTIVRDAWMRGQQISVHGWIYGLNDGLLRDIDMCVTSDEGLQAAVESAVEKVRQRAARAEAGQKT